MRKIRRYISLFFMAITFAATLEQLLRPTEERDWHGKIMFVPYDFRPLNPKRIMERWWNPDDPRVLTPHVFGVGWSVNLYRLKEMLSGSSPSTDNDA
jgi:hypothetical protein